MAWNYEESKERLSKQWQSLQKSGINIAKLSREMDLNNLSPSDARLVHGVHVYAAIMNFSELLADPMMRRDDFKRLLRYCHCLQVELRRVVQDIFEGDKIQVQGPKFHGLIFKPYDDDQWLAWKSVLAALAFHLMLRQAVPQVFPTYPAIVPTSGLDLGDSVVANVGIRGDRELISIGRPANYAAKVLDAADTITIGESLWSALESDHQDLFNEDEGVYRLDCGDLAEPEKIIRDAGFSFSIDQCADKLQESLDSIPLDSITVEEAKVAIDLGLLGPRHAKTCGGASIFVDIDGYTALIDSLKDDLEALGKAVQILHLFRYELRQVTEEDFSAVTIQHQGDRLQALLHVPAGEEERICRKAVDLCISYNSTVEEVLNVHHNVLGPLHVAIGCDYGKSLVSRLGVRGDLDSGCFGDATLTAETIQLQMKGKEIGITGKLHEAISDEAIRGSFSLDEERDIYIGNATWAAIEQAEQAKAYSAKAIPSYSKAGSILFGISAQAEGTRPLKVTRPWGV